MTKPTIHIGDGPYQGPPRMGEKVFCGKTAGSTFGVIVSHAFFGWGSVDTDVWSEVNYIIHLTRKGLKTIGTDYREEAARSIKSYGYYSRYLEGNEFKVCKKCLGSEEFGMLALASL